MVFRSSVRAFCISLILWTALFSTGALSQSAPPTKDSGTEQSAPKTEKDPLSRETPQGMVAGLMNALAAGDYDQATRYFQTAQTPVQATSMSPSGAALARAFQKILDRSGAVVTPADLSSEPQGRVNDGLDPDLERFGFVKTAAGEVPLLARRVEQEGRMLWLVSDRTLNDISWMARVLDRGQADESWLDQLPSGPTIAGAPSSHWLLLLITIALSYTVASAVIALRRPVQKLIRNGGGENRLSRFVEASAGPLRLLLTILIFSVAMHAMGISVVARYRAVFLAQLAGWAAFTWLLWRWTDAASELILGQMSRRGQLAAYSALSFLNRAFKAVLFVLLVAATLRAFGVNVTAGLAALGVGGLAIALGAQKLFENLIGSLTLVADRPVRIGDFCRFGTRLGTVEEIGIRSTRIRTLDRTILTVPNGEFAALHIENYSQRDRFWFHPILNLRYETSVEQMRMVLRELRKMLDEDPNICDSPRVRFISLGAHSLDVEIFAYIRAADYSGFLEVQEGLLLRCVEIVEGCGTGFAFPSQTLYIGRDKGIAGVNRTPEDMAHADLSPA